MVVGLTIIGQSADFTHSQPFSLGPGETAFALQLPAFDPDDPAHAATPVLKKVTVTLTATFGGGFTFFNDTATPVPATGNLSNARVLVTTLAPGALNPAAVSLALAGGATVPGNDEASLAPVANGTSSLASTDNTVLTLYTGTGTLDYDVDFSALYPPLVTTSPSSITCLVCNDRVTGTLSVTYTASSPSPTAAVILEFAAQFVNPSLAEITWRTGVESNLLGFHLERQAVSGDWTRVNPALIPATGGTRPENYRLEDTAPGGSLGTRYRLQGVNLSGNLEALAETVLVRALQASIETREGMLELTVTGQPNRTVVMLTSTDVAGPWTSSGILQLDAQGQAVQLLPNNLNERSRFYRLLQE